MSEHASQTPKSKKKARSGKITKVLRQLRQQKPLLIRGAAATTRVSPTVLTHNEALYPYLPALLKALDTVLKSVTTASSNQNNCHHPTPKATSGHKHSKSGKSNS
jgi:hypothetical protein